MKAFKTRVIMVWYGTLTVTSNNRTKHKSLKLLTGSSTIETDEPIVIKNGLDIYYWVE